MVGRRRRKSDVIVGYGKSSSGGDKLGRDCHEVEV
jgi:hypothetical protein